MKEEAVSLSLPRAPASIVCRDRFNAALEAAQKNAYAAGVMSDIQFELGDVRELERPAVEPGSLCINPPYGERLGAQKLQLEGLYKGMSDAYQQLEGWRVIVLSGSPVFERAMKGKPEVRHKLWNGPIEARLLCYQM